MGLFPWHFALAKALLSPSFPAPSPSSRRRPPPIRELGAVALRAKMTNISINGSVFVYSTSPFLSSDFYNFKPCFTIIFHKFSPKYSPQHFCSVSFPPPADTPRGLVYKHDQPSGPEIPFPPPLFHPSTHTPTHSLMAPLRRVGSMKDQKYFRGEVVISLAVTADSRPSASHLNFPARLRP